MLMLLITTQNTTLSISTTHFKFVPHQSYYFLLHLNIIFFFSLFLSVSLSSEAVPIVHILLNPIQANPQPQAHSQPPLHEIEMVLSYHSLFHDKEPRKVKMATNIGHQLFTHIRLATPLDVPNIHKLKWLIVYS